MNMLAIAWNAWTHFVRDRIFYLVLMVAFLMLGFSFLLATLTIVESRKILLDFCFSASSLAGGMTAVYLGVVAVAKEIEQRTIYTIVTKPVSRASYFLGKFLGTLGVLAVTHVLLALSVVFIVHLMGEGLPGGFASCELLIFLENVILLGFAFLCSAFASSLLATGLTISFFLIGRSNLSFKVMSEHALTPETKLLARVLYDFMPNLERFNLRDVVAYGRAVPPEMLGYGFLYAGAYLLVCLSATCLILQSRDLP